MALKPFAVKGMDMTSPRGTALWCKIKEPDYAYNEKGIYSTSLVCDPNEETVKKYIEKLEELRDVALAETRETLGAKGNAYKARPVFTEEEDRDGNATGNIIFKFKMNNVADRTQAGHTDKIFVVDAKRQVVSFKDVPLVGNGSKIRCVGFANPYSAPNSKEVGISLIWTKMQLIELIEYSNGGGDDFEEEEGFTDTASAQSAEFTAVDDF
jgi:hypothetical protein